MTTHSDDERLTTEQQLQIRQAAERLRRQFDGELNAETAMLTAPLQEELDKLQSDLKKAEEKVKRDIGL